MRHGFREIDGEAKEPGRPAPEPPRGWPAPEPPRAAAAPAGEGPDELRVLLADRYPRMLRFMTMVFTSSGCCATAASTADEALDLLAGDRFDLVVADSELPGLSGPELLRVVRERHPHTAVILTTDGTADPGAVAALDQAYGHLRKPFALEEVQRLVERLRSDRRPRAPRPGGAAPGPVPGPAPGPVRPPHSQPGLAALSRITELALPGGDPSAYLEQVLPHVVEGLGARAAVLVLRDEDGHVTTTPCRDPALASRLLAELGPRLDELLRAGLQGTVRLSDDRDGAIVVALIPGTDSPRGVLAVATGAEDARVLDDTDALLPCFASAIALSLLKLCMGEELESQAVNTISSFVIALESRDAQLKSHSARVSLYAGEVAKAMGLPAIQVAVVRRAGMLHDLGTLAEVESAPAPSGPPAGEPLAPRGLHSLVGARILKPLRFLAPEAAAVRHQHERYDGKGNPDGLIGEAIPLAARIVAVADAFDSLTSQPPFGSGLDIQTAMRQLIRHAGAEFDPGVTETLSRLPAGRLVEISQFYDAGEARSSNGPAGPGPATFVGASRRLAGRNGRDGA